MKCSKCGTEYDADPTFASEWMQVNGQNRNHTDAMCRDVLAERLAWFREMPAAIRLERVEAQLGAERARSAALEAALVRAHCDLRWYEGYSGTGSVALAENRAHGFTNEWEIAALSQSPTPEVPK